MTILFKRFLVVLALILAALGTAYTIDAHAKSFGASSRAATSSRSFSTPARAPTPSVTVNKTINQTTVVQHSTVAPSSGGGGNGMLLGGVIGYMLGSHNSRPAPAAAPPVQYVQAAPAPVVQAAPPQVVVQPVQESSSGWGTAFMWLLILIAAGAVIYVAYRLFRGDIFYTHD